MGVDETREAKETKAVEAKPEKLSPAGQQAMQEGDAETAAREALAEGKMQGWWIYNRRYASEGAARSSAGSEAVNLDTAADGFKGHNYPTYDISSPTEVSSVKTHWNSAGELDDNAQRAYIRDFNRQLGWGREGRAAVDQDGLNLIRARDESGIPVPEELREADAQEASNYLYDYSIMRIPDDHVEPIRNRLREKAQQFPETYNLSSKPSPEELDALTSRIQGIGLSSSELQAIIDSYEPNTS